MPTLTIVTVCYNNINGLKKTVESVLHQTWKNFEYVIIDGGSTDGTKEYLESISNKIFYWVSEPDKGIYHAMNKGIAASNGEYLVFLNSGDHLFNHDVLQNTSAHFKEYDLICFNQEMVGTTTFTFSANPVLRFSDLYFSYLPHASILVKRDLFARVGLYDESLKIISDWKFFMLALFRHQCSYVKINQVMSTFYLDGVSATTRFDHEKEKVLKENFPGFIDDYEELRNKRIYMGLNRFKMLYELEKLEKGQNSLSFILRVYMKIFSKKKISDL